MVEDLQTLYLCQMNTVYLVFDQFEELYISGSMEERKEFLAKIKELVKSRLNVKIILSLREEYIAYLADSEEDIPGLMDFRLRVEKMNTPRLLEVVQNTAKAANITLADESIPQKILTILSVGKKEIELSYLQVYFYKLYNKAENKSEIVFDTALIDRVGKAKDVLAEFLEEKLDELRKSNPEIPQELPMHVLNSLITDEATKKQVSEEELFHLFPARTQIVALEKILEFLDQNRILRILKEEKTKVELAHDILARIVYEKLSAEQKQLRTITRMIETNFEMYKNGDSKNLLSKKLLETILPFEDKLHFEERQGEYREYLQKSKIQARLNIIMLWSAGIIVSALILGFGGTGLYFYFESIKQTEIAEIKTKEALAAEAKAVAANSDAKKEKEAALEANRLAAENKEKAKKEKKAAEEAKKKATDLQAVNKKKETEINDITGKLAKGFSMDRGELLNASDLKRWSRYQGAMGWEDAQKRCAFLGTGWRVPKRGEWQVNFGVNKKVLSEDWIKDQSVQGEGAYYWTSEEMSKTYSYYFDAFGGYVRDTSKEVDFLVRCIR